ncbi:MULTISPECIES: transcription antitermination factor NusB [Anaerococcus]|jgi:transcription antitermination factor nusB|uniref:transcription antitermination factor NusB n=1 Tax=Anaerococcus TaxID=165779 RepID=UPI001AE3BAD7|nr:MULTISPECIES: transcription antitermination factor NusB [Anaerococcus]MBP2069589.1 N utilization substance protein B [Anaerococcus nagyae]MDU1828407.1 transcription antitermination factor NusB [Anaerococcus sp.]MDU1864100.1 transcription antitermination factor NusB [Anaerococcus sp.]
MKRSEQREWVFKLIYEDSINRIEDVEKTLENHDLTGEEFIKESIISYNENYEAIEETLKNTLNNRYKRLSKVEKAILFLSINEMRYMDIPVSVSINEAVELTKIYSDEKDYQMINSVLGKIVRS